MSETRKAPSINNQSQKIVAAKNRAYVPIHLRYKQVQAAKDKKVS